MSSIRNSFLIQQQHDLERWYPLRANISPLAAEIHFQECATADRGGRGSRPSWTRWIPRRPWSLWTPWWSRPGSGVRGRRGECNGGGRRGSREQVWHGPWQGQRCASAVSSGGERELHCLLYEFQSLNDLLVVISTPD